MRSPACCSLSHTAATGSLTDYFFLLCFAAPLNLFFERCGRRETGLFVLSLLVIASSYFGFVWGHAANTNGYTLLQFIMLYALGRYVRIGGFDLAHAAERRGSICSVPAPAERLTYLCVRLRTGQNDWAWRMTYYNDPLLVAAAVGVLLLFRRVRFSSRAVNSLAASALAVYLFQEFGVGRVAALSVRAEALFGRPFRRGGVFC